MGFLAPLKLTKIDQQRVSGARIMPRHACVVGPTDRSELRASVHVVSH
eukprot:SAG25_NODE_14126_length_258_cov_2.276730_1_plen_47_part_01